MSADWLEIKQGDMDAQEIARRVQERLSQRDLSLQQGEDPVTVARVLWEERIGPLVDGAGVDGAPALDGPVGAVSTEWISIWRNDCDLVPRNYTIDWRMPILGPIHALIRRIVNAEIRRYLMPALEKQSFLNQKVLQMLEDLARQNQDLVRQNQDLARENTRLWKEIERLQGGEE